MIDPENAPSSPPEEPTTSTPPPGNERSARWAAWAFGAYVIAGLPLLVLVIGKFWWFFRDDWFFITDRDLSVNGLFDDHNGHWSTSPVLVFRALYATVGLNSYAPYKATVVVAHLVVAVCIRAIMRRYGVGPWLATALAGSFVLLGSGREDILWAFQIGFTFSVLFGLLYLVLVDHDGAFDRRDGLGVLFGFASLASHGPGLAVVTGVMVTVWLRRG